ncbi:glycosyl hydrolase family 18 protein [Bacillus atrophaeus]|uniref:glycosyl hydrolase family 18 protein n=1 Tax=Bacillus atrophaeus TaxID=1452 RepID=UPI002282084F|nr:glycosyl hydrolase family 18 protein [Bacillus atrophaeus]MCY8915793.1 glycosyl hydrolase family 18 protein [Bacillus atrophaeus]MCY8924167.1 glycosyl hydrolase family 18 protein [Bacillus atrophaeus]
MKKTFLAFISLAIALALFTYSNTEAKAAKMTLGYTTGDTASYNSLTKIHKYLNSIATDTFAFDKSGNLIGEAPNKQLTFAKKNKIKTWAVISNYNDAISDFDGDLANRVMTIKTSRKHFIDQLVKLAKKHSFYGVNIDFEAVNPKDRSKYSSLIQDVSATLKKKKIKTMVSVPAKSADDKGDDWSWPYDYAKIGKYADYVQVMTYDEHGIWGEPGSVASTNWIKSSLQFAVKKIKPNKVVMGIPSYGNDWDLTDQTNSTVKQWTQINTLKKKLKAKPDYNKKTGSMTFSYVDKNKHKHVVWYENEKTIQTKSHLVKQYKIAGVSVYALGHESASFWKAIQAGIK